jgi:nucleoside-diphosphate-sugar epimerase
MRVLVTGGTGFVGSHTVAATVAAGHEVRLLVRRPEQVARSLSPLALTVEDLVAGDVLDPVAVAKALDGCEAVIHAAAIFSLDPRRAGDVTATNARAAETVLGQATAAGLDPVVHVSSTVALARYGGSGPALPLGDLTMPYAVSKVESERVARRLQEAGSPLVSVYPGGVFGPYDPYLSDQNRRLLWMLRGLVPIWPRGAYHVVDVRETAAVLAAALQPGRGPRRYVVPGHHLDGQLAYGTLREVTGRRLPRVLLPAPMITPLSRLIETANTRLPSSWYYPAEREGVELVRRSTRFDTSAATADLGVEARPLDETFRDTAQWLVESGHLHPRYGPRR